MNFKLKKISKRIPKHQIRETKQKELPIEFPKEKGDNKILENLKKTKTTKRSNKVGDRETKQQRLQVPGNIKPST